MQAKISISKQDLSDNALAYYLSQEIISIDCEMMGLNIRRDRLCMVQIGDANKQAVLVQIELGQKQAPNLKKLLESSNLKLFHYARTDLAWLKEWLGIDVNNFFCTKVASKLARTYSDKHGLKELCKEVTGKEMNKNQQASDWGQDEVSKEQMQYAADDVFHLVTIYTKLKEMLVREGKWDLALECCKQIPLYSRLDTLGYHGVFEH